MELTVNGTVFEGWTSARVTAGLTQAARTFEASVTDVWEGKRWEIRPFDRVAVSHQGMQLIDGYVDAAGIDYDAESHTVRVSGRSKTCDIVDCSATPKQYKRQTLNQIASDLCAPFGIKVIGGAEQVIASWKPDEGSQIFHAIEDLARLQGLLVTDNANGDLVLTSAGKARGAVDLELGKNIKACSAAFDVRDRFSEYIVKGQQKGSDTSTPELAAHPKAQQSDGGVPRYRPLLIQAEDQIDVSAAQTRALWEKNTRIGKSQRIRYTVTGWTDWIPNTIIRIKDSFAGIDTSLLLVSVEYSLDAGGTTAVLELMHPGALVPEPIPPKPVKSKRSAPAQQDAAANNSGVQWEWDF